LRMAIDMMGKKYGQLLAISPAGRSDSSKNIIWVFKCSCGRLCEFSGYSVRSGKTIDCQLCSRERLRLSSVDHGKSNSVEFRTWTDIQSRCHNPNATSYPRYGGRGIEVCARWRDSFSAFLEDMGPRPNGMSIERNDNDKNYTPDNCRWATRTEQANNRKNNVIVTIDNESKTIAQWASHAGIKNGTMWYRVKAGYSGRRLLCPVREGSR
jgi:hypothetical protein